MQDNIIIENIEYTEEKYIKAQKENIFYDDILHGIGDDEDGNS